MDWLKQCNHNKTLHFWNLFYDCCASQFLPLIFSSVCVSRLISCINKSMLQANTPTLHTHPSFWWMVTIKNQIFSLLLFSFYFLSPSGKCFSKYFSHFWMTYLDLCDLIKLARQPLNPKLMGNRSIYKLHFLKPV